MIYRLADQSDIPGLARLLGLLFEQEADFSPQPELQVRGLEMILEKPEVGAIFVASDENQIYGMINILFTISTALGSRVATLEDMVVFPESRGKGVGSGLIEKVMQHCRDNGIERITLLTDSDNVSAHAFYRKHFFEESPMKVFRHFVK